MFGYFWFIFLLSFAIKSDMKTAQKIVHNWIYESIFSVKVNSYVIFGDNQFMPKHTFHIKKILQYTCFNELAHMLNRYKHKVCFHATNY